MYTITARNVNEALFYGVNLLKKAGVARPSRVGNVLEFPGPVATTYTRPLERVLFCRERDANPFLHLFETLWMLKGRDDAKFMTDLVKRFEEYSDDGKVMQGSYGYRWRQYFGYDQIANTIDLLKRDPYTRRAVITMWDPDKDPSRVGSSDIPCNTQIYFKIRDYMLHMTVCNRSNDMIWGAYGANVVHMSILQEYMAEKIGVNVGTYTQVSDSFHVYTSGVGGEVWNRIKDLAVGTLWRDLYSHGEKFLPIHLGASSQNWDVDLALFFHIYDQWGKIIVSAADFESPWWKHVAVPMWNAFVSKDAEYLSVCMADDWRLAAREWLERRKK